MAWRERSILGDGRTRVGARLGVCVVLAVGCASQPAAPPRAPAPVPATSEDADELDAALREMEAAFARGDMQAVAGFYADDALMLAPGGARTVGREAIDAYWARFTEPIAWTLESHQIEGNDRLVHMRGRSTLDYRRDGEQHRSVVEFVLVWERAADGRWTIVVDAYW